jgi:hypothetical protein
VPAKAVPDLAKRATSRRYVKSAGRASGVLAYGTAALDQWGERWLRRGRGRPDLDSRERAGRIAGASLLVGSTTIAGAAAGAAIGSAVVPGVGTVVGAVVGSLIGSGVGAKAKGWLF